MRKENNSGKIVNGIAHAVLLYMAHTLTHDKKKQKFLKTADGWMNFAIGLCTEDGSVAQSIRFKDGKASVASSTEGVDTLLTLKRQSKNQQNQYHRQ